MGRWEPDGRGRLEQAALALFGERGFENTTVAQIAARAGLTERTFFRYFTDKREVLFWGAHTLEQLMVTALVDAPPSDAPLEAVAAALGAAATVLQDRSEVARKRHAVIAGSADLRERELIKLSSLAAALGDSLRRRGTPGTTATLTAEAGIAVFRVAFERWVTESSPRQLRELIGDSLEELRLLTAR